MLPTFAHPTNAMLSFCSEWENVLPCFPKSNFCQLKEAELILHISDHEFMYSSCLVSQTRASFRVVYKIQSGRKGSLQGVGLPVCEGPVLAHFLRIGTKEGNSKEDSGQSFINCHFWAALIGGWLLQEW